MAVSPWIEADRVTEVHDARLEVDSIVIEQLSETGGVLDTVKVLADRSRLRMVQDRGAGRLGVMEAEPPYLPRAFPESNGTLDVVGRSDSFELELTPVGGARTLLRVRGVDHPARADEIRERREAQVREDLGDRPLDPRTRQLLLGYLPDRLPAFAAVSISANGDVWVARSDFDDSSGYDWLVFTTMANCGVQFERHPGCSCSRFNRTSSSVRLRTNSMCHSSEDTRWRLPARTKNILHAGLLLRGAAVKVAHRMRLSDIGHTQTDRWLQKGKTMRRCMLLTISGLCLSGCTATSTYHPNRLVPLARGSVDTFVPLVSSSVGQPRCKTPADAPLGPGGHAVALVFPRPMEQQVTVTFDGAGTPTRYVDVRGDLSTSDESVADRTTIVLFLDRDYALLSNSPKSGEPVAFEVPLVDALSSQRLGNPTAMLQRVVNACKAGR